MGFRLGRTYILEFDKEHQLHGVEVRTRWASIETIESLDGKTFSDSLPVLLDHVISWNLEDENGTPIPPDDMDAVKRAFEPSVRTELVSAWMRAAWGATTGPLEENSGDGGMSPEAVNEELSIPMETP